MVVWDKNDLILYLKKGLKMIENILLPVDHLPSARHAAEYAAQLAKAYRSKVTVLHAYKPAPTSSFGGYFLAPGTDKASRKASRLVDQIVAYLRQLGVERVSGETRVGSPGKVLTEAAEALEPDLIVVSSGKEIFSVRRNADRAQVTGNEYDLVPILVV
jgi:nucleotide-binding universal stress UspA family protein